MYFGHEITTPHRQNPRRLSHETHEPNESPALASVGKHFVAFVGAYSKHFISHRHDVSGKARQYACGLMQGGSRKNMDRMAEVVPDSKSRNLQQFITHSKWDSRAVMNDVAVDANILFGQDKDAGLKKQGRSSVGVSRQWLGRLGKVDNGQVAVFGVLANNRFVTPVDTRLYLPKQWAEDSNLCEKAGIPKEFRTFKTKDELALDMVRHLRGISLSFGWVGADGGYGKGPKFCEQFSGRYFSERSGISPTPELLGRTCFSRCQR